LKFQSNASSSNNVLKHIDHKIDCFKDPIPYLDLNDYGENVYDNLKGYKDDIYILKVLIKGQLKHILSTMLYYDNYSLCGGRKLDCDVSIICATI
jgi:hypothetical protein